MLDLWWFALSVVMVARKAWLCLRPVGRDPRRPRRDRLWWRVAEGGLMAAWALNVYMYWPR